MLFALPDHAELYRALLARDEAYDGRAYVGVSSTGIFCRLTCPARKPKPENCSFYESIRECIEAGFRPCKRCVPLKPAASVDPTIDRLLTALEERPEHRWCESDLDDLGFERSSTRKSFKRHFGMTFLEMARHRRLRGAFETMRDGGSVIDAQLAARFESASAFRESFGRLLGRAPGHFSGSAILWADWIDSPLGDMISISSSTHLHLLEFVGRKALRTELVKLDSAAKGRIGIGQSDPGEQIKGELAAYFNGQSAAFATPLALNGSAFSQEVWRELMRIPPGQTRSYSELAASLRRPSATRAVARANGANQIALVIPCHRVIGADGSLTGYGGGLWRKQKLLEIERQFRAE